MDSSSNSTPVKLILDTDMSGDCDDAGAMAVLHKLADFGECELLACVLNGRDLDKAGAATIRAINVWYGRRDIPVGTYQGTKGKPTQSAYTATVRDRLAPHAKPDDLEPLALDIFRQALAEAPDGSVTIVSIGFLMNLRDLLESEPDCSSSLAGPDLVRQKVKHMVLMGGQFPARDPKNGEYNFAANGAGLDTKFVIENWSTPILFTGWEIGERIKTGGKLAQTPANNPVRPAYELHAKGNDHWSWDQTAILAAVRAPELYWDLSAEGFCVVASDGTNTWSREPRGHRYLIAREPEAELAALIDDLMMQLPRGG